MESWRKELYHHGILGQKLGIRRFQNPDGSLTPDGKKRYSSNEDSDNFAKSAAAKFKAISTLENKKKRDRKRTCQESETKHYKIS